jgi:hypothetical protein
MNAASPTRTAAGSRPAPRRTVCTDQALLNEVDYQTGSSSWFTRYYYDYGVNGYGRADSADIEDGRSRTVEYKTTADGAILSSTTNVASNGTDTSAPASLFYWFDGVQQGDVTNNGQGEDVDYVVSISDHTKTPPTSPGMKPITLLRKRRTIPRLVTSTMRGYTRFST